MCSSRVKYDIPSTKASESSNVYVVDRQIDKCPRLLHQFGIVEHMYIQYRLIGKGAERRSIQIDVECCRKGVIISRSPLL